MADSSITNVMATNIAATQGSAPISYPADIASLPFFTSIQFYAYSVGGAGAGDFSTAAGISTTSGDSGSVSLSNFYSANIAYTKSQITKGTYATINLPIPTNLNDSFGVTYENTTLGGLAGAVNDVMAGGASGAAQKLLSAASGVTGGAGVNVTDIGKQTQAAGGNESLQAAGKLLAKYATDKGATLGVNAGGLVDLQQGSAINPNLTVLFRGPTLKSHTFTWTITPRNATESQNIKEIIGIIKRAMHPTRPAGGLSAILGYPCECLVQFVNTKSQSNSNFFIYPLRPCVVEQLNINYAPSNVPSFFQSTNEVTALEITIHLQETSYYTRDSFDSTTEYGGDGLSESLLGATGTLSTGFTPDGSTTPSNTNSATPSGNTPPFNPNTSPPSFTSGSDGSFTDA